MRNQVVTSVLVSEWKRYQEWHHELEVKHRNISEQMKQGYDKQLKELPDFIRFRTKYDPPVINTLPMSFEGFIDWLQHEQVTTAASTDSSQTEGSENAKAAAPSKVVGENHD